MNQKGEAVLTVIVAIIAGIGAFLSVFLMDDTEERCWAKENASKYYPENSITCSGENCRATLPNGFVVNLDCSCGHNADCRIEK